MTHDEFKNEWAQKHQAAFSEINAVLARHGLTGSVTGLHLAVPRSVLATAPQTGDCSSAFKLPPCDPGEQEQICTCSDGGGMKVFKCCV